MRDIRPFVVFLTVLFLLAVLSNAVVMLTLLRIGCKLENPEAAL